MTTQNVSIGCYGGPGKTLIEGAKGTGEEVFFYAGARSGVLGESDLFRRIQGVQSLTQINFPERSKVYAIIVDAKLYNQGDNTWYLLIKVKRSGGIYLVCWNANVRQGTIHDTDQIPE